MEKRKYDRNIKQDIENGYYRALIIMADSEIGVQYYYDDFKNEFAGYTEAETLDGIIDSMYWKYEHEN